MLNMLFLVCGLGSKQPNVDKRHISRLLNTVLCKKIRRMLEEYQKENLKNVRL